jgi:hypothetical protein
MRFPQRKVSGKWRASSLVAGVFDFTDDSFGRNDQLIANGSDAIITTIASIRIKGSVEGSAASSDFFGITPSQSATPESPPSPSR